MIQIELAVDDRGIIRLCEARGHAGAGRQGADIVCAAVSVLVRSFLRATEGRRGIIVEADVHTEGFTRFRAVWTDEGRDFLFAAGEFLIEGLRSVAEEFPRHCSIRIRRN
jgi:uncharacterized protein YsxB (DUF464 family)